MMNPYKENKPARVQYRCEAEAALDVTDHRRTCAAAALLPLTKDKLT